MKRLTFFLATLFPLLAGCSQDVGQAEKAISTGAPAVIGKTEIVAQIEAALVGIDADSALHVAVDVQGGDVTLSGRAKSATIAQRFVAAAKGVKGVKSVASRISVDPKLPSATAQAKDFALSAEVSAALIGQAGINAFTVKPTAHAGVVTLSGTAKSDAIKTTILETAKHAAGVKSVVDRISVKT
jgi:osmotically-inducible protein OsmY